MTVPSFADIGKNAWDIFKTGYHYGHGLFNLSITTESDKNLCVKCKYSLSCDTSKIDGKNEATFKLDKIGSFTQKWLTDGTLSLEYGLDNKPIHGLSMTTGIAHNPSTSISNLLFGAKFKNEMCNCDCSVSNGLDVNKFRLTGAAVVGAKDLHVGYSTGYDTATNSMTNNDLGLHYNYENIGIHLRATNIPLEGGASIYYKANENFDTAINGIYAKRNDQEYWTVGVGTRMKIDESTTVRLKLNKDRQMGASLQQKISNFIKLTLSFNVDFNDLQSGDHKVGLAIDVNDSATEGND